MEYKDKFNNKLVVYPSNLDKDTLMGCFAIYLCGNDTRAERMKLRKRLLMHFKNCLDSKNPYVHPCIRSFVNRIHFTNEKIPKSAESFFMNSETEFISEGLKFIQQNSVEGFISDKHTFAYLISELFKVHVHLNDMIVSYNAFEEDIYSMYIIEEDGRFQLLTHYNNITNTYKPPNGLEREKSNLSPSMFVLRCCEGETCNVIDRFTPPHIEGYRVHHCNVENFDENLIYVVTPNPGKLWRDVLQKDETLYVYSGFECLTSVTYHGKTNPYFYIIDNKLACVIKKNQDDADKAVRYEVL